MSKGVNRLAEYEESFLQGSISADVAEHKSKFRQKAAGKIDPQALDAVCNLVLPHQVHAGALATGYQKQYERQGVAAYLCAAYAVLAAATIHLLGLHQGWYLVEIGLILAILWLTHDLKELRHNWTDHRYLAERLRATVYLYLGGKPEPPKEIPPDFHVATGSGVWMHSVHEKVLEELRLAPRTAVTDEDVKTLAPFLATEWIEHQRGYYNGAAGRHKNANKCLERGSAALLWMTLGAAALHLLPHELLEHLVPPDTLVWIALVFPAFSAAFAGISVFQHYERNSERYASMRDALDQLKVQSATTSSGLADLLKTADQIMSHEHQGWRFVHGIAVPKPG